MASGLQFFFKLKHSTFFCHSSFRELHLKPDCVLHIQVFMGKQKTQEICHMLEDHFHSIKRLV